MVTRINLSSSMSYFITNHYFVIEEYFYRFHCEHLPHIQLFSIQLFNSIRINIVNIIPFLTSHILSLVPFDVEISSF